MGREERVEKLESKGGAHLAREAPLNVRGVDTRCTLDEDDAETDERPRKSLVRERIPRAIPRSGG